MPGAHLDGSFDILGSGVNAQVKFLYFDDGFSPIATQNGSITPAGPGWKAAPNSNVAPAGAAYVQTGPWRFRRARRFRADRQRHACHLGAGPDPDTVAHLDADVDARNAGGDRDSNGHRHGWRRANIAWRFVRNPYPDPHSHALAHTDAHRDAHAFAHEGSNGNEDTDAGQLPHGKGDESPWLHRRQRSGRGQVSAGCWTTGTSNWC